jgi:hypothetical protein
MDWLAAPPGLTPPRREVDLWFRSVNGPKGWRGHMRTLLCVLELQALTPGQPVAVHAVMRPSADVPVHAFTAEAFIALPP